jgi:YfiR/HmsC-like
MRRPTRRRRPWPAWSLCLTLSLCGVQEAAAVERAALEAAIVFNVLQFVEWPNEGALAEGAPLTLCLSGDSPLFPTARQLEGRPVRRMQLRVLKLQGALRQCQAVYLDSAQAEQLGRAALADSVLLIGGSDFRPAAAPSIQLVPLDGRLAFDIDQRKARQSGVAISSRLLKLARTVTE